MNLTKFWAGALVVALALVVACSTEAPPPSNTDLLVPSDANLIAEIQVAKILRDAGLQDLCAQAPKESEDPQTLDEALDLAFEESGIDFRNFQSAVLFSDVARAEDYVGVIANGQFDESQLIAAMESEVGLSFTAQDYQGVRLHVDESDPDAPAIAVLDSSILIAGTLPAVKSVIDVREGNLPPMSGPAYDAFNGLGTPLIRMAVIKKVVRRAPNSG